MSSVVSVSLTVEVSHETLEGEDLSRFISYSFVEAMEVVDELVLWDEAGEETVVRTSVTLDGRTDHVRSP